jgi:uncharacterized membrane protein
VLAFFALLSAGLVGSADFLGGLASRSMWPVRVAARGQGVGFVLALPLALALGADRLTPADVAWSAGSGLAVGVGLAFFYSAMALGQISIVTPISALIGTILPVTVGLAYDSRPGTPALAGMGAALAAIAIVSVAPSNGTVAAAAARRSLIFAVTAGVCFGMFLVCLAQVGDDTGLWPIAISRAVSAGSLGLVVLVARSGERVPARQLGRLIVSTGALEIAGVVSLLLALRQGSLAIASVLGALYPVTTVLLAAFVLHERLTRLQLTAVILALGAIVLVSTG